MVEPRRHALLGDLVGIDAGHARVDLFPMLGNKGSQQGMERFVICARGRSGSSAIRDELNGHPQVVCHGELFRPNPLRHPNVRQAFEEFGKEYPKKANTSDLVLPFRLYTSDSENVVTASGFGAYMAYLESEAGCAKAVGAKVLANHVSGEVLFPICAANDVFVLILRRRNQLRQAVSALVAKQTGVHNSRTYTPEKGRRLRLDPNGAIYRMRSAFRQYAADDDLVSRSGQPAGVFYYEDWRDDRRRFFEEVCARLGVDFVLPTSTTFKRTTPEPLSALIENYDEFAEAVRNAGFDEYLNE